MVSLSSLLLLDHGPIPFKWLPLQRFGRQSSSEFHFPKWSACYTFQCTYASYVGDAGNSPLVDAGTLLGATVVVTPGSAGYLLWECCILASL